MKIQCLGTGGYHPTEKRHTACYYLPDFQIVLDAGTGMFRLCPMLGETGAKAIDIFVSHAHLDHVMGLTYLLRLSETKVQRATVHMENEKIEALRDHLFSDYIFPVLPPIEFRPLRGPVEVNGCKISWFGLRHPGGSAGFRLDAGSESVAYVTDTAADAQAPYLDHIHGVDLLIHECYFDDDERESADLTGHSCVSEVAKVAQMAEAKRLLLIHVNPWRDHEQALLKKAQKIFENTTLATDGMAIET